MRLYDYIREEVSRQGHDVTQAEGQLRIAWMWGAWEWAREQADHHSLPGLGDIEHMGTLVEPEQNQFGFRNVPVRVGPRICPPPADVIPQLRDLLDRAGDLSPPGRLQSVRGDSPVRGRQRPHWEGAARVAVGDLGRPRVSAGGSLWDADSQSMRPPT